MNRRGFTVAEVMVALVITGLLAGVIFQFIRGQERFVGAQSAREEVQQNGRAALELLSSELRGLSPQGIVAAGQESVEFRLPRIWGLVCGQVTPGTWAVVFPGTEQTAFRSGTAPSDSLAVRDSTTNASPRWRYAAVSDDTPATGAQAANTCATALSPTPAGQFQVRSLSGVPGGIPLQVGEPVYLYDVVSYSVGTSNAPGRWLRRSSNRSDSPQPLAGPLREETNGTAFRLRYFDANGAELTLPVPDPSVIARIDLQVVTISRSPKNRQEFSDSVRVYLRN